MKHIPVLLVALFTCSVAWAQTADTILTNGKIITVDQQFSSQEAIAVRDGRILSVGKTADIRKLAGPNTRLIAWMRALPGGI